MTNLSLGMVFLIASLAGGVLFICALTRRRGSDVAVWFMLLCLSNFCWCVCHALFYLLPDENLALMAHEARFAFVCLGSIHTYLFILKTVKRRTLDSRMLILIYLIPALTLLLALSNDLHGLMRAHLELIYLDNGVRSVDYAYGPWFYVHTLICYAALVMSVRLLIAQIQKLPRDYRTSVWIMLLGIGLAFVGTLASLLSLTPMALDIAPIAVQISQCLFYVAFFHTRTMDMLFTSREVIFEDAGYALLVLDPDGRVLDFNKQARLLAEQVGILQLRGVEHGFFLDQWLHYFSGRVFPDDHSIVTISQDGADHHYQVSQYEIRDSRGRMVGAYMEIKTITPIMTLIHRLQETAYYDHLTGLYNRHSFARLVEELEDEASLPLGVVAGDVNNLKRVNDTYGHLMGDRLLEAVTEALTSCSPPRMIWARLGGDEFAGLLSNTNDEEMGDILGAIQARCRVWETAQWNEAGAGIALSYRLRTSLQQSIESLLNEADLAMYTQKNDRRR